MKPTIKLWPSDVEVIEDNEPMYNARPLTGFKIKVFRTRQREYYAVVIVRGCGVFHTSLCNKDTTAWDIARYWASKHTQLIKIKTNEAA